MEEDMAANSSRFRLANQPVKLNQKQQVQVNQLQRTLFSFLYLYAILIIGLYVTYAAYYYYQHHQQHQHQHQHQNQQHQNQQDQKQREELQQLQRAELEVESQLERRLESKLHLLERYLEVLAVDLQETKGRLREREKCDCSQSCTFNGTRYQDQSSWQHQCDTCTCQLGRISCSTRKCPPPSQTCDALVQLPGKCCPVCMKSCSYNERLIKHGHKFRPLESGRKECKCMDGLIMCDRPSKATRMSAGGEQTAPDDEKPKAGGERISK